MDAQSGRVSASGWIGWLPGIATPRSYEARWLPHDIAAGLVLTTALARNSIGRRCQPNGGSSTRRANAISRTAIYSARARDSAKAAERLCL
jgi:hypothetical protein